MPTKSFHGKLGDSEASTMKVVMEMEGGQAQEGNCISEYCFLVGGFNPFEISQIGSSPQVRVELKNI